MSRKVVIQYVASGSPDGSLVYDVKSGRNSILTSGGCSFNPSLLRVIFPNAFEKKRLSDELVIPDNIYLSPFRRASGSVVDGDGGRTVSDASHGVSYEHITQVCGQLRILAVHPRLDLADLQISATAYNPFERRDDRGGGWISGPTRNLRLCREGDSSFVFDGKPQINISEKLVIKLKSITSFDVSPSDFLATMTDNLFKRRGSVLS